MHQPTHAHAQPHRQHDAQRRPKQRHPLHLHQIRNRKVNPHRKHQQHDAHFRHQLKHMRVMHMQPRRHRTHNQPRQHIPQQDGLLDAPGQQPTNQRRPKHHRDIPKYDRMLHSTSPNSRAVYTHRITVASASSRRFSQTPPCTTRLLNRSVADDLYGVRHSSAAFDQRSSPQNFQVVIDLTTSLPQPALKSQNHGHPSPTPLLRPRPRDVPPLLQRRKTRRTHPRHKTIPKRPRPGPIPLRSPHGIHRHPIHLRQSRRHYLRPSQSPRRQRQPAHSRNKA